MAKLIVFAAILVALLALAEASRFTITTTVDEEDLDLDLDNPFGKSRTCQRQIQQQSRQLRRCHQYLSSRGRSPFENETDTVIEQYGPQVQQKQQQLRDCCQGLQNLQGNRCKCQAIEDVVQRVVREVGEGQPGQVGQKVQQIKQAAKSLPRQCQLGIQECPIA